MRDGDVPDGRQAWEKEPDMSCIKCGEHVDVDTRHTGSPEPLFAFWTCFWCQADTEGYDEWLKEFAEEMFTPDIFEKVSDGVWRLRK